MVNGESQSYHLKVSATFLSPIKLKFSKILVKNYSNETIRNTTLMDIILSERIYDIFCTQPKLFPSKMFSDELPYRGKFRRGKVTNFWASDECFSPTNI